MDNQNESLDEILFFISNRNDLTDAGKAVISSLFRDCYNRIAMLEDKILVLEGGSR